MNRYFILPCVVNGLCLDPPFSSFVDRLTTSIHVEASQIDFSSFQNDLVLCDSTEGPLCHLLYPDTEGPALSTVFGSDMFSRTLGIPSQVSVSISGPQLEPVSTHSYLDYRLRQLEVIDSFEASQSRFLVHLSHSFGFSKAHPVGFTGGGWLLSGGDVVMVNPGPNKFEGHPSLVFGTSLVVQYLRVVPRGPGSVLMVGKLRGREQWRREEGRDSLLGKIVFARWRGNGSIFRGKVVFDEGDLGATISWADGDSSYRQVARSDIVSVVPGQAENLREVDEIEFIHYSDSNTWFELADLVVTMGHSAAPVKVIRSGGGMVFEDHVSAGSVMYSVSDLISRRWRVQNSLETRRDFSLFFTNNSKNLPIVVSLRNIVLLWKWSSASSSSKTLIKLLVQSMNSELVAKFMNLNDLANAVIDQSLDTYAAMFQFQSWLQAHRSGAGSKPAAAISSGDSFEGNLNCDPHGIMFKLEIVSLANTSNEELVVVVRIKFGANFSTKIPALFIPSLGMLQIPANELWKHAMSLFFFRSDEFSTELIGTGNDMGCGGVFMSPIHLEESTRASFKSVPITANISELKNAFLKFNNFLIKSYHGRNNSRK